ncbi:MAG: PQQ-like beta-propeller repeat protein [Pelagibacteraceae bacterium]|jgi:outer membrane protein assembly factor BamB|nr:PQQ-like beta-propeller repeat protein [Pelagibacteraceae bacterium]
MKKLLLIFFVAALSSCSFDNKTGIWKDASDLPEINQTSKPILNDQTDTRYENIVTKKDTFNSEKDSVTPIKLDNTVKIANWFEEYAIPTNNISNFYYDGNKILLSKSRKLSQNFDKKNNFNKQYIFYKDNLISYDHKGKIYSYSIKSNKKVLEYNFYQKNFKKFRKKLNFIVNENILYVADNIGYLYSINLDNFSIVWAKNYGIPFRSNLKLENNQIFLSNQDNVIYSIDAKTGNKNWEFATGSTFLKSDFINNFALDITTNNLYFLNTSGELYSINYLTQKINWVLNFKNPLSSGETDLFLSYPLIIKDNNMIVSTEKSIVNYDTFTGVRKWILYSEPIAKPIITQRYTFAVLSNNLLICVDNISGNVVWAKNFYTNIKEKQIRKFGSIIDFKIVNGKINIYYNQGYLLSFDPINHQLISSNRISKKGLISKIFFLKGNMLMIDNNNKLLKYN